MSLCFLLLVVLVAMYLSFIVTTEEVSVIPWTIIQVS